LLAAHGLGLGACPQAYLVAYPDVLRKAFKLPKNKKFLLGISLGYYKKASKVNEIKTFRNEDVINYFE
jgi:nitroreductase